MLASHFAALLVLSQATLTQAAPATADELVEDARTSRDAGNFGRAIKTLNEALKLAPRDPNILRLLGSTLAYDGQYREAIIVLEQARQLAPSDQDIALALARAQLWAGNVAAASRLADAIGMSDRSNAELPALLDAIRAVRRGQAVIPFRADIAINQSVSRVEVGRANRTWQETVIGLAFPLNDQTTFSAEIGREDRSTVVDARLSARIDRRFSQGAAGYVSIAATPDANFRERWSVRAGADIAITPRIDVIVDARFSDFGISQIGVAELGARVHGSWDGWTVTARSIHLLGENGRYDIGWSLRGDLQADDRLRLYVGGSTYPDNEAGVTRRMRSAFVGMAARLGERVTLRATYEYDNRDSSYSRNAVVLGLSVRL